MASTIDVLAIKVQSDGITKASRELDNLGKSADTTEKKILKLIQTVEDMVKRFSSSVTGTKALTDALSVVNRTTQASDSAMKALTGSIAKLSTEVANLNARLTNGSTAVTNHTVTIRHNTAAMTDAHAAARGLTGSLGALWLTYGNVAPLAAGAAIGASLKQIITIGADVENTLEAIRLKTGATIDEMQRLNQVVTDLGKGIYGPQEVAKALEVLSLAGLKATDAANAVGAALNLATSGGTTIEKSAEALVTIGTAVGATSQEYDYLADAIQKTANISLASVDSIAESVKRASVVNKLYGASFEDILTQTAALAQLGIKNTAAGTAITNFYANARAETEKAKKAVDALGFSFQDSAGKVKPLVQAFTEYDAALKKFDTNSQKNLITAQFGERALRDVQAVLSLLNQAAESTERLADGTLKYKNRLEEVSAEVSKSAGTAALVAAEQALTTTNQFKTLSNTLQTAFSDAFTAIAPMINNILKSLQQLFASPEFTNGVKNLAQGFASLAETLVSNIKPIGMIVEGFLAVAAATAGGALFTKLIPSIVGLITVTTGLATSMTSLGAAANIGAAGITAVSTATKFLPGVGIVLGLLSAAYALYSLHADKATKSTKEFAEETSKAASGRATDFIKNLDDQIDRLKKVNAELDKGKDLAKANAAAADQQALAKQRALFKEAEIAAQLNLQDAQKNFNNKATRNIFFDKKGSSEALSLVAAQNALNTAKKATIEFEDAAIKRTKEITRLVEEQKNKMDARNKAADAAAQGAAGTKTFGGGEDKGEKKALTFLEEERLALAKNAAVYDARTKAVWESYRTGEKVAAESKQAMVIANEAEGKYLSKKVFLQEMALAKTADEAKANHDRAVAYTEIGQRINDVLEAEKQRAANAQSGDISGKIEGQIVAAGKLSKVSKEQLGIDILRARAADEILKKNDERLRLEAATKSSSQRAEQYADELELLEKYGVVVKQTAIEFAKAEIAKRGFLESSQEGRDRLGAAALEDLNKGLLNLQKTYVEIQKDSGVSDTMDMSNIIGVETAKVALYEDTKNKYIQFEKERVEAALAAAVATGKITEGAADIELMKLEARLNKMKAFMDNKLEFDFKIGGLKDISTIFDNMADSTAKMGQGFERTTKALGGFSSAFGKLAKAQEMERKKAGDGEAARIGAYGDMTAAAGMFFAENSRGYQAAAAASKVLYAAETALNVVKGVSAILTQGSGDPYSAFGRMAAMAAIVVGLGVAISGGVGGSGGASAESVQKTQGTGSVFGDSSKKSDSIIKSLELLKDNSDIMLPLTQGMLNSLQSIDAAMNGLSNLIMRTSGVTDASNMSIQTGKVKGNGIVDTLFGAQAGSMVGGALAGPIGMWIGSVIGGLVSKLWGGTTKNIVDSGISFGGNVSSLQQGQGYNQYASVDTTKKSLFGLIKKTTNSVETQALDKELSAQFGLIFTNLEESLKKAGAAFGKSGDSIGNVIANTVLEQTTLSLKDLKGDELTDAINAVISKAMDQISEAAIPGLDSFRQVGEGYTETIVRVASGIEQSQVALERFGITSIAFTDIVNKQGDVAAEIFKQSVLAKEGLTGVAEILSTVSGTVGELAEMYTELNKARSGLNSAGLNGNGLNLNTIKGAGGLSQLQGGIADYRENFFTDVEKNKMAFADLSIEFAKLGKSLPVSKDALKDLIIQTDALGTDASKKLVGQLLVLTGAFSEASDSAKEIADNLTKDLEAATEKANNILKSRLAMELEIAEYNKNAAVITSIVAQQRQLELKAMDESLRPLQERINAIKDEKAAYEKSINTAESAYNKLSAAVGKQKESVNKAYDFAVAAEKKRSETEINAAKKRLKIAEDNVKAIEDVFSAIDKAIESTKIESDAISKQRRTAAQALIRSAANSGANVTKIPGLTEAISDISKPSEDFFGTFEEYAMDQAIAKDSLERLQSNAQTQLDFAKLTVDRLNSTIESIEKASAANLEALALKRDEDLLALDQTLELARTQIDILKGIDTSIISLGAALKLVSSAIQAVKPLPGTSLPSSAPLTGVSVTDSIKGLYKTYLGRDADPVGLEFWQGAAAKGLSLADIAAQFLKSEEYKNAHSFAVGTNYIPNDMMAMVHEGERIIPKSDNAELMRRLDKSDESVSGREAIILLQEIKEVVMAGDLAVNQKLSEILKIERKWDNEGLPEERDVAI